MNKRQIFYVIVGVIALHGLAIYGLNALKVFHTDKAPDAMEFRGRTITYVTEAGETDHVVKEFTVSTKLAGEQQPDGKSTQLARP